MRSRLSTMSILGLLLSSGCAEPSAAVKRSLDIELVRTTPEVSVFSNDDVLDVTWATESTLFVATLLGQELDLVHWDGTRQHAVARKGNGPGEVQGAAWLLRSDDSTLVSVDILQPRITWWTVAGGLKREANPEVPFITGAWITGAGLVLRVARPTHTTFTWFDDSGGVLQNVAFKAERSSPTSSCGSCATAIGASGLIAMATADTSYRFIRVHMEGDTLQPVERRGIPLVRFSTSQRDSLATRARQIEALLDRTKANDRTRARFRSRMYPEFAPRFMPRSIFVDDDDRLWVQRQVATGDSAEVDLFDVDAEYRGTMRLPPGATLRRVHGARMLMTVTDAQDRTSIAEFRLVP